MKILVAVKRVPDYRAVIRVNREGTAVETTNVKMSMNPFDEIAVEEAIRLKEKKIATETVVVSIGAETSQETLRTALAMGMDRGLLIKTTDEIQPLAAAKILQQIVAMESPQLVILGKQSIDSDNNQVGQMLAGLLNWPQATFASKIECHDEGASVTREIDGGLETIFVNFPAVITTDLRLNEPRYISLPNIMQAKRKPLEIIELSTLNLDIKSKSKIVQVSLPDKTRSGVSVTTAEELVDRLMNEAQVI